MNSLLPVSTLARREVLRFFRQRSRMIGVLASPVLFWIVIGSGLKNSFSFPSAPDGFTYLQYFYPGSVVLVILFSAIFSSISVIEDRKEGFLQSVLVAPISRTSIVFGKIIGISALSLVQGVLFLVAAPLVDPSVSAGAIVLTVGVLALVAFGLASFGFLIAWLVDSSQGFHALMNLFLIPLWMLSGAIFPTTGAAPWVAAIMQWNPLTYGVAATRISLYGLDPHYIDGLPDFGTSFAVIIVFGLAVAAIAVWRVETRERGVNLEETGGGSIL